jgi:D-sedoheptulose 7-phosphate isomerase
VINTRILEHMQASASLMQALLADRMLLAAVEQVVEACEQALRAGAKVLFAGNGGSAADAQHMAGEFVSRFHYDRPGMAAIALTVDSSVLTAIGNDYGYERVFARQIEALGRPGDVFFAYSTSGQSPNILHALRAARALGMRTVGLTGNRKGAMNPLCDHLIEIPSASTPSIQEGHLVVGHAICAALENAVYPLGAGSLPLTSHASAPHPQMPHTSASHPQMPHTSAPHLTTEGEAHCAQAPAP